MLTLDRTTLFYLSYANSSANTDQEVSGLIAEWAAAVKPRPSSKVSKSKSKSKSSTNRSALSRSLVPLTHGSTRPSSASGLSTTVLVTSSAKINDGLDESPYGIQEDDEIYGPERDAAISSPTKGKKRVDNTVSKRIFLCLNDFAESSNISLLLWLSIFSNVQEGIISI